MRPNVYILQAALLCEDCGIAVTQTSVKPRHVNTADESSYDSDEWPKGPYGNGGGEADTPQHCDHCGTFLQNPLTPDGDTYVREKAAEFDLPDSSWEEIAQRAELGGKPAIAEWSRYYFAYGQ
jgi:hypothetical protein